MPKIIINQPKKRILLKSNKTVVRRCNCSSKTKKPNE